MRIYPVNLQETSHLVPVDLAMFTEEMPNGNLHILCSDRKESTDLFCKSINRFILLLPERVAQGYSVKKLFLEISQNSQENTCEFCEISKNILFYKLLC